MTFVRTLRGILPRNRIVIAASLGFFACCVLLEAQTPRLRVQAPAPEDTLHIVVGHSVMLHGDNAMKRVFVGNPAILSSFNSSANDILITAKEPGVSSLAIWDTDNASRIYTVSVDLDPAEMQRAVDGMYPIETVHVTGIGDRIELNGTVSTPEISESLTKLGTAYAKQVANSLRILPVKPQEVQLKLQIVEVDRTKRDQFAVNFSVGGKVPVATGTGAFADPLNLSIGYLKESVALNIQALAQHSVLQILAEPTLTTLSGQPARFLSGGEFPIPVVQSASTVGSAAAITIQFRPYGVKVDFLPVVGSDGNIRLKISPEVSTLDYSNAVTISGFTIPALSTRRAETEIELKDGQSFILSGLLDHRTIENLGQVPGIAKIPLLGELFRSKNNTHSVTELVFIVTATVIDPLLAAPPSPQPTTVEPYMSSQQFDDETQRKQAAASTR